MKIWKYRRRTYNKYRFFSAIQGIFSAQYQVLRENGHSPSEATVEELN